MPVKQNSSIKAVITGTYSEELFKKAHADIIARHIMKLDEDARKEAWISVLKLFET